MEVTVDVKATIGEESIYMNQENVKKGNEENGLNTTSPSINSDKSGTMDRKRVEFTENTTVNLIKDDSKIKNGQNLEYLGEANLDLIIKDKKGEVVEVKMTDEEIEASLANCNNDQVTLEGTTQEVEMIPMSTGRRPFLRSGTLPHIKKTLMSIPKRSNTLLKKIKAPSIKLPEGRSASLNFEGHEMHVVKNVNTLHIPTKKEIKNGLIEFKTSFKKKPTLARGKTLPMKTNYQMNGDEVSLASETVLDGAMSMKRAPPPRPNYGPSTSEELIMPTASASVNAEDQIDLNNLNPTRFQPNSHYNSQTLSYASPKKKMNEIDMEDNARKFNTYLDKLRKKISDGSKSGTLKANGRSVAVVMDRQEVYNFSLKNRSLNRRMTSLNKSNTLIQPIVSRPKLQQTLRNANDPEYITMQKNATLDRSNTISTDFYEGYGSMRKSDKAPSKNSGGYFQQKPHEIETQGSPYYGERLKQNLPKDLLKPEAMEKTNPFVEYMKNMKRVDAAGVSNAQDSDVKHLQAYLDASLDLKNAELRPEYMNFFVGFSSLNPRKYIDMGSLVGWRELKVFRNTENSLDYIKLIAPKIIKTENTIAYPLVSIDSMLTTWLEKKTSIPENVDDLKPTHQDLLHTLSYMSTLADITQCIESSEVNRVVISLSVLLSLDYCLKTYPEFLIETDPSKILIVGAPTNSLIIFRLKQPIMEPLDSSKVLETYKDVLDILKIDKRASMEQVLDDLIASSHVSLHHEMQDQAEFSLKLLKCISPPDWTAVCMSRVGLKKLEQS